MIDKRSFVIGSKIPLSGGGGTSDYDALSNRPSIGGVTLSGDLTAADLGLAAAESGKGLSTNDFTDALKDKLDAIGVTASAPLEVTKTDETYNVTLKDSGVTAGSKGDATNQTPGFGGTFKVLSATVDAKGHVTALEEHSVKIPDAEATQSAKGLMSAADKTKLDTLIDATLSDTGKAADAKTTGDNLAALRAANTLLRELINGVDTPIYRTASGNPATFRDGAAANVKSLSVTITPTQSGSGDPSPTNVRPIAGVSSVSATRTGKNMLDLRNGISGTGEGVTYTRRDDGSYARTGTSTGINGNIWFRGGYANSTVIFTLRAGHTYFVKDCCLYYKAHTVAYGVQTITPESDLPVGGVRNPIQTTGATYNDTIYPMIIDLTAFPDANTDFEPYQGQTVTVPLVDSNGDPLTVYGGTLNVTTGELRTTWAGADMGTLSWSKYDGTTYGTLFYSDSLTAQIGITDGSAIHGLCDAFPIVTDTGHNGAAGSANEQPDKSVRIRPNDGRLYLRYEGQSSAETLRAALSGVQFAYRLAAPVTYQLTPAQIATLSGYNAVSSDAGTLSVTYRADPSLAYAELESNLTNAILSLGAGF